jgi:hypothetical protein
MANSRISQSHQIELQNYSMESLLAKRLSLEEHDTILTARCGTITVSLVIVTVIVYWWSSRSSPQYIFPPSPPGRLPIVGHNHLFPKQFPGEKTKEWGMFNNSIAKSNFKS